MPKIQAANHWLETAASRNENLRIELELEREWINENRRTTD